MGCARADNHCDLTAAAACFDTITQSGLMTQFQNTDMSNATAEMLMNTCRCVTFNDNNKSICKAQNLVPGEYSKRARAHTHTHKHTQSHPHTQAF